MREHKAILMGFCGMLIPIASGDKEACESAVTALLERKRSQGYRITPMEKGNAWEILEPADAGMVPDDAGILELIAPEPYICPECGCDYQDEEDAMACCDWENQDDA